MNDDLRAINELKLVCIDMINRAKSGSPGICLDMAPMMYTLFTKILNVYPNNPNFFNRDRVILSSSRIAPLYYAMLHMAGFPIAKEDLMNFKRCKSITPGIPDYNATLGVDASTGFAGDGVGIAIGLMMAKRYLNALIRRDDDIKNDVLTYSTFCFCSDADILSGTALEAFQFAVAQNLKQLVFIYDFNNIGADGERPELRFESTIKKFQAMGMYVDGLKDFFNVKELVRILDKAKNSGKPALIVIKNVIGADSFNAGKNILHDGPLSYDDTENLRKKYNSILAPFEISKDSKIHVQTQLNERSKKYYNRWNDQFNKVKTRMDSNVRAIINMLQTNTNNIPFDSSNYRINDGYRESLLESNYKIMNIVASKSSMFLGGSAGDALTTRTTLDSGEAQTPMLPLARNIRFGPREKLMGNVLNGMSLTGLRVFGSTKLCYFNEFSSTVRMSALMNLPVIYVFTHDSLYDCEDGPARIPCEQLASLRAIPNLTVYRPADINEVMGTWESVMQNNKPVAIVISKNNIPKLPGSNSKEVAKGAYIIKREQQNLHGIIIATGSEVVSALQIAFDLSVKGLDIRVVSMPSVELFKAMGEQYRQSILPPGVKTIVMEAGSKLGWQEFVSDNRYILSIDDFAYCGITIEVLQAMNYDYESLKLKVESLLKTT